ncbi:MAG: DUF1668 domain-containing protein [Planctomycetota bacterium]
MLLHRHLLLCCFMLVSCLGGLGTAQEDASSDLKFADLPFEITSFGAARVGKVAYVYGGHTGAAHSYSNEEQSNELLGLNLSRPKEWRKITTGERLQGLAMVASGTKLILIGGFTAKNDIGEEHDLHSQTSVRAFDTATKAWTDLPGLPEGRSSHDACIIGETIYVVGGWKMAGEEETVWHTTALSIDLSAEEPQWEELPSPPFKRRALATMGHEGKLFVIGGMSQKGPTKAVSVFDTKSETWSVGPELPGKGMMAGFGAAAWSHAGKLVVSTYEGKVLHLSDDHQSWEDVGATDDSRFFHRLLPLEEASLISIGGANMREGKFLALEVIELGK